MDATWHPSSVFAVMKWRGTFRSRGMKPSRWHRMPRHQDITGHIRKHQQIGSCATPFHYR
jgi:hypothetical protein